MPDGPAATESSRPLEPIERISEALFGLIMVLTFTCSISVAEADRAGIRTMLIGAFGCNLVWGVIDAILYLMGCLAERGQGIAALRAVRAAGSPEEGHRVITGALPPVIAALLQPADLERLRQELNRQPEPPPRPRLTGTEWLAAFAIFLWVLLITLPVAVPFVLITDVQRALRVSNAVAIVLLFIAGYGFGRAAGLRPWLTGLVMVFLGAGLVAATIALGG